MFFQTINRVDRALYFFRITREKAVILLSHKVGFMIRKQVGSWISATPFLKSRKRCSES